jgi:hypothetical protein
MTESIAAFKDISEDTSPENPFATIPAFRSSSSYCFSASERRAISATLKPSLPNFLAALKLIHGPAPTMSITFLDMIVPPVLFVCICK